MWQRSAACIVSGRDGLRVNSVNCQRHCRSQVRSSPSSSGTNRTPSRTSKKKREMVTNGLPVNARRSADSVDVADDRGKAQERLPLDNDREGRPVLINQGDVEPGFTRRPVVDVAARLDRDDDGRAVSLSIRPASHISRRRGIARLSSLARVCKLRNRQVVGSFEIGRAAALYGRQCSNRRRKALRTCCDRN